MLGSLSLPPVADMAAGTVAFSATSHAWAAGATISAISAAITPAGGPPAMLGVLDNHDVTCFLIASSPRCDLDDSCNR